MNRFKNFVDIARAISASDAVPYYTLGDIAFPGDFWIGKLPEEVGSLESPFISGNPIQIAAEK
jgi:hypothetical protein